MKFSVLIIFIFAILNSCTEKFEKLSSSKSDTDELLKKIEPNKDVKYWQLERVPNWKDETKNSEILFKKGSYNSKENLPIFENDWNGFFTGCQPVYCAYRITFLENNVWKVAKSKEDLKKFIGKIDNENEAFLIGIINDYSLDYYSEKGNGYLQKNDGYKIKMMIYNSCPETKESFTLFITKEGKIQKVKNNGFYLKSKNCFKS